MIKIIIKQSNSFSAVHRSFRSYAMPNNGRLNYSEWLGIQRSSTLAIEEGARRCAVETFHQLVEPNSDVDELETRISLKETAPGHRIWQATLQPKSVSAMGGRPPITDVEGKPINRAEVIEGLREAYKGMLAFERSKDRTIRGYPDMERILDYIEEHGLDPK